jgi:hypothetical protein
MNTVDMILNSLAASCQDGLLAAKIILGNHLLSRPRNIPYPRFAESLSLHPFVG